MRYQSLDIFKALGIIYLVCLHQLGWFFTNADGNNLRFDEAIQIVFPLGFRTGLHVLGLQVPLLAGVAHYLSVQRKNYKFKDVLLRGLMLIASGYMMNLCAWGISDVGAWDVLQFIGLCIIVSYPFLKNKISLGALSLLAILTLYFSSQFPFSDFSQTYIYKIIVGDIDGYNYWPMCPWFFIFVVGIFFGKFYFDEKKDERIFIAVGAVCFLTAILTGKYHPGLNWDNVWGAALFKPSIFFVFGIIGFSLMAIPLTERLMAKSPVVRKCLGQEALIYIGRNIFWVYIFSTIIGYRGTTLFLIGFSDMNFQLTVIAYIIFIILNLIICYHLIKLKDRIQIKMAKD